MNYTKEQLYKYGMRDIPGYEGLYGITSCGRVWSYRSKKFLKPRKTGKGYLRVCLSVKGDKKEFYTHQLVAKTYIPNPDNLIEVLHNDETRNHNWINNLRWGTHKENCNEPLYKERRKTALGRKTLCEETGIIYPSAKEAHRQTGIWHIAEACNGNLKTAGGYHWRWID